MSMTCQLPIAIYQQWIGELYADGREIWFGTLQFHHLARSNATTVAIMQTEATRIYKGVLTNMIRAPSKHQMTDLPILIGCPDRSVAKHRPTARLIDVLSNDALHYHFLLAVPPLPA